MSSSAKVSLSIGEARAIVPDLFKPSPWIYWTDFLITITIAYSAAATFFLMPSWAPAWSPQQLVAFVVAGFALHRLSNFIHDVAHLNSKRHLRSFQVAWNILAGVPMLMPSFFFEHHMKHHQANHYGTKQDGEYLPLGRGPLRTILFFMMQIFIQPPFVIVRFIVITPISFLHPRLREWVLRHHSSFVFDFPFERHIPKNAPRKWWAAMEIMCCLRALAIFVCVYLGVTTWVQIPKLFLLATVPLTLHYFRSLTAHNWRSDGSRKTFHEQLDDSIDIKGNFFTELFYPVGLRYHAMHHLFPSMPYHNLGTAHRRFMKELPEDSPYRDLVYPSVWSVLKELFHNARATPKQEAAVTESVAVES